MKFPAPVSVQWIGSLINAEIAGYMHAEVSGITEIHKVEKGDLVFVDHPKYYDKCLNSNAGCIIINSNEVSIPEGKTLLVVAQPFEAYLAIVHHFRPFKAPSQPISADMQFGDGSVIMPNVYSGPDVTIGKN